FPEFVAEIAREDVRTANGHWQLQTAYLFLPAIEFTHIGRLEQLGETLTAFFAWIGHNDRPLTSNKNTTGASANYDEMTANMVYRLYESDFTSFKYDRSSWPQKDNVIAKQFVPESRLFEEIRERNIVIGQLYREHDRLSREVQRLNRDI